MFAESNSTGLGMVIRHSSGGVVPCRIVVHYGLYHAREAKAMCLHEAIAWTKSMELKNVIFETDSKVAIDTINSSKVDLLEFSSLVDLCRSRLNNEKIFHISFARRQINKVIYAFTKVTCFSASPSIWMEMPSFIDNLALDDCNSLPI
ncbi:hypothetical protein DITRI_Ditri01bG0129100 [Diplodiscus trichospermus]